MAETERKGSTSFEAYVRDELIARALRTPRASGDTVESGDEVCVSLLAFRDGKLLPFSAVDDCRVTATTDAPSDVLSYVLVGATVGAPLTATLRLPEDHPVESLRGLLAEYAVEVKEALTLKPGDDNALESMGLGGSREEALGKLVQGYKALKLQDELRESAEATIDFLVKDRPVAVSEDEIDDELRAHWRQSEGKLLQSLEMSAEDRMAALKAWLDHPAMRASARRRLAFTSLLNDFIARERVALDPAEWTQVVEESAKELELSPELLQQGFDEAPADREELQQRLIYFKALQRLLESRRPS